MNWRPGAVWLEHTGETAAVAAAATTLSLITPGTGGLAWGAIGVLAGKAALYAALYAVVGLRERNGTASLNPRVVAKSKPEDA